MERTYCPFPYEYLEEMVELNDAEFGRLARALIKYSATGEPIALSGNERFYAKRVMMREDRFQKKITDEEIRQKRSEAGKAGAAVRWQKHGKMANDSKNGNIETEKEKETYTLPSKDGELARARASDFSGELREAFEDWLAYKTEKRQPYKPTGLKNLISEIRNNAEKYGEDAVAALIRACMAANWQGIAFDRLGRNYGSGQSDGGAAKQSPKREWNVRYAVDGTQGADAQRGGGRSG